MKKIFSAALSLLISSSVFAGHHEDLNIKELKTTYQAYVDDFISKDFESIANHFQAPMMKRTQKKNGRLRYSSRYFSALPELHGEYSRWKQVQHC
jgi:predicted ester cyclase